MIADQGCDVARPAGFELATDGLEVVALRILMIALTCVELVIGGWRDDRGCAWLALIDRCIGHVAGTAAASRSDRHTRPLNPQQGQHLHRTCTSGYTSW